MLFFEMDWAGEPKRKHSIAQEAVRGLGLWMGAALLGSFGPTLVMQLQSVGSSSEQNLHEVFGLGLTALVFTASGSGLLVLAFASMGRWSIPLAWRYGLLVVIGAGVGMVQMLPFGTPTATFLGISYGSATALSWVILHLLIYRGR